MFTFCWPEIMTADENSGQNESKINNLNTPEVKPKLTAPFNKDLKDYYSTNTHPENTNKEIHPSYSLRRFWDRLFNSNRNRWENENLRCINKVKQCISSNPMVKTLLFALLSKDCPVDLQRHIACEPCFAKVSGGFDPVNMQVVVCHDEYNNNVPSQESVCTILTHELIHAFDMCRAKLDFENLEHLACTEIRAANLTSCSLKDSLSYQRAEMKNSKEVISPHKKCVIERAILSVMTVRNVSREKALEIVERVFERCYNDTEPFDRQIFKDLDRGQRCFEQSRNYYSFD